MWLIAADQVHAIAECEHVADSLAAALGAVPALNRAPIRGDLGSSSKVTFARRFAATIFLMLGISSPRCGNSCMSILARGSTTEREGRARQRRPPPGFLSTARAGFAAVLSHGTRLSPRRPGAGAAVPSTARVAASPLPKTARPARPGFRGTATPRDEGVLPSPPFRSFARASLGYYDLC